MRNKARFNESLEDALRIADRVYRNPLDFQGDAVVIPLRLLARGARTGLTPARLRVLDTIRRDGPFSSLDELATCLTRPLSRVSQDVRILEGLDLVHSKRHGKAKRLTADRRPILLQ